MFLRIFRPGSIPLLVDIHNPGPSMLTSVRVFRQPPRFPRGFFSAGQRAFLSSQRGNLPEEVLQYRRKRKTEWKRMQGVRERLKFNFTEMTR
jgi:hypothetical protein